MKNTTNNSTQNSTDDEYIAYYKEFAAKSIEKTRQAIETAIELINNGEDGPSTMRHALHTIDDHLDTVDTAISLYSATTSEFVALVRNLREQYAAALEQRNRVIELLKADIAKDD